MAARALLAGIAERGADAVGYAYRSPEYTLARTKEVYETYYDVRYPGHERQAGRPLRLSPTYPRLAGLGAAFGEKSGIICNDDELFEGNGIARAEPGMSVDSEIIFALAARSRGRTAAALEQLYGSMAAAWLDEGRPELLLARGMGRPLWLGAGRHELFFSSTRLALELVESYGGLKLKKSQLDEGTVLAVEHGAIVARETFSPDLTFEEEPLPAVRAPHEARSCLERLATLHAAA